MTHPIFRLRAIPQDMVDQVRTSLCSPQYKHPAHVSLAAGYGPCRVCLQTFRQGLEERILFTYNPSPADDALPQPGPVFIHRDPCTPHDGNEVPSALCDIPLYVEGFGAGSWNVVRIPVHNGDIESAVAELWSRPDIAYAHLRNAEAGCFIAAIERLPSDGNI